MHNPEYEGPPGEENDETGYSEKDLDMDAEIKAGEWQSLRRFRIYKHRSRQGKIIATYQAVSNRLNQLVGMYYKLVGKNPRQGQKMLAELKKLRMYQDILLQCLVWEPKGLLTEEMVPEEVWEMIE